MATYRIESDKSITYEFTRYEFQLLCMYGLAITDMEIVEGEQLFVRNLEMNLYWLEVLQALSIPLFEDKTATDITFVSSLN